MIRPSAGTSSPAASSTTSPTTTSSAAISASDPSRRTRAVALTIALSAFIALSALPSWRRPTTALSTVISDQQHAGAPLLDRQRHDRRAEQDHLHVAAVLLDEPPPARHRLLQPAARSDRAARAARRPARSTARPPDRRRASPRRPRAGALYQPVGGRRVRGPSPIRCRSPLVTCPPALGRVPPLVVCAAPARTGRRGALRRLRLERLLDLEQRLALLLGDRAGSADRSPSARARAPPRRRSARTTCDRPGSRTTAPTPCSCARASRRTPAGSRPSARARATSAAENFQLWSGRSIRRRKPVRCSSFERFRNSFTIRNPLSVR